jgi:hypothetical protein
MPRSMPGSSLTAGLVTLALGLVGACAQTSKSPPSVTAPSASESPAPSAAPQPVPASAGGAPAEGASATPPAAPSAAPSPLASAAPGADVDAGVPAQYRACRADADCVAVPRAGCCDNGWKEAVAASQKSAYERAFACAITPHPMCPMYIARDTRIAKCEPKAHLCVLVQP